MDINADDEEGGGATWLMTFADLMALLMSFFVLLLSFSEMDIQKYKQVAGSMKEAFGIQREVESDVIPKGTSLVAKDFSPGNPVEVSLVKQMYQRTTDDTRINLEVQRQLSEDAAALADLLRTMLKREVKQGMLDIIVAGSNISIRIREQDSFPSGSAKLHAHFAPVLSEIAQVLLQSQGTVMVGGHTDSVPIANPVFASNWELSAGRAGAVIRQLVDSGFNQPERLELRAYAATRPVSDNATAFGRSRNRRVDITININTGNAVGAANSSKLQADRIDLSELPDGF